MSKDDITAASSNTCVLCGSSLEKRVTELELRVSFEQRIEALEREVGLLQQIAKKLIEHLDQ